MGLLWDNKASAETIDTCEVEREGVAGSVCCIGLNGSDVFDSPSEVISNVADCGLMI